MPNWIEGDLKVRGTKENIRRFLLEGLEPSKIKYDNSEFTVESIRGLFYIKGTKRHFIQNNIIETYINDWEDGEERVIVLKDFMAAWYIDVCDLSMISREFNIDFKILGFECGMEFNQDVEIIKGEIIKNEEIKFDDYAWECVRPHIGG